MNSVSLCDLKNKCETWPQAEMCWSIIRLLSSIFLTNRAEKNWRRTISFPGRAPSWLLKQAVWVVLDILLAIIPDASRGGLLSIKSYSFTEPPAWLLNTHTQQLKSCFLRGPPTHSPCLSLSPIPHVHKGSHTWILPLCPEIKPLRVMGVSLS